MKAPKRRTIDERWTTAEMYPHRIGSARHEVESAVTRLFPAQPYATHGSVCADLLYHKLKATPAALRRPRVYRETIIREVIAERSGMVGRILVYSYNDKLSGVRRPKTPNEQRAGFRRNLFAVYSVAVTAANESQQREGSPPAGTPHIEPEGPLETEPEPEPEAEPEPTGLEGLSSEPLKAHHEWGERTRSLLAEHGHHFSMRPIIDGIALIAAGCPPEAVRDACMLDYPDDLREQCGVKTFDFMAFGLAEYVSKAAKARVIDHDGSKRPVCIALIGPAGIGKTTAIKALANGQLRSIDMSAGTPLSAFYGIKYIDGSFTTPDFQRWAEQGGWHLFGEVDSSDPNLLKVLNKALANREYTNPVSGETIRLHEDAIAVADSNTLGLGIQAEYSAAEQLDFSTVDRFRAGRVRCTLDRDLEASIVDTQIAAARA